jgi:hypothetical protein
MPILPSSFDRVGRRRVQTQGERLVDGKMIYWHRELPPLDAELIGDHIVEASSGRVTGIFTHRDELWNQCYAQLMENTGTRLAQEVARLGGDYAHVHDESIKIRHDEATGEAWLHGRFSYTLYRQPTHTGNATSS